MTRLSTRLERWVYGAQNLLFPPVCVFCGLAVEDRHACCHACAQKISILSTGQCRHCGRPLPDELAPGPCGRCLKRPPPQVETVSLYTYDGPVREAILSWKLSGQDAGLMWLLHAAKARLRKIFDTKDVLLPVPMPMSRMRKSGQHHAADLCRHIAAICGCRWEWRLLRRVGEQPRQSALTGSARAKNLRKAFVADNSIAEQMQTSGSIWIVDDIFTTGATTRYASRAVKAVTTEVRAFTLARAINR